MIPNLSTRPVTAWVTILVVALHGAIAWAMVSIESPTPVLPENKPKVIHLELVSLASTSEKTSPATKNIPTEPQTKPLVENPSPSSTKPTDSAEEAETTEVLPVSKVVERLKTKTEQTRKTPKKSKRTIKKDSKLKDKPESTSSEQTLTIVESRRIANRSDKEEETEDDLSAMIRAVTAQYNREQAIQQNAVKNQANKKLMEQEQWRIQAANEAISKMLALAAEQAENQNNDKIDSEDNIDKKDEDTAFLANDGSWMAEHEPITSIPALVWRSINTRLGDVFIVVLELHVNKEGYVTEVQLLESSTSPIIDAIATTQVRGGQLNPFIQNGVAVDAIVPMSLAYERP